MTETIPNGVYGADGELIGYKLSPFQSNKDIKRWVIGFRQGLLRGKPSRDMCFAVCAPLQALLSLEGVETKLVEGKFGHYWLELPDGQILDPTADQFVRPGGSRMPPVYLGKLPRWYNEPGGLNYAPVKGE